MLTIEIHQDKSHTVAKYKTRNIRVRFSTECLSHQSLLLNDRLNTVNRAEQRSPYLLNNESDAIPEYKTINKLIILSRHRIALNCIQAECRQTKPRLIIKCQ